MKNRKEAHRRKKAAVMAGIAAIALIITGTLAWQAISQRAVNNVEGEILPAGARLHDDFGLADEPDFTRPLNKDVYVENYSGQNPLNTDDTGEPVFVRVKLMEYMETGAGAGLFSLTGDDPSDYQTLDQVDAGGTRVEDPANNAVSLVPGGSILNLSTWRTHVEDDPANPFAAYWNWTMGGTKAFMPTFNKDNTSLLTDRTEYAHNEFAVGDKENGTARYANPTYDSNPEEHTAKDTLTTAGIVSMDEWMNDLNHPKEETGTGGGYWVGDTDGWYYWSKGLEAGEATALLLDQITLTGTLEGEFYYGIHVISEMATAGDWGDEAAETGFYKDGLTADGKFLLDQAAAGSKKEKLLYAPMDDIGTSIPDEMLLYAPMDDTGVPHPKETILYAPMDGIGATSSNNEPLKELISDSYFTNVINSDIQGKDDKYKFGGSSLYFAGINAQRINIRNEALNFGTKDFTVSFWLNPDTQVDPYGMLFSEESNRVLCFMANDEYSDDEIGLCIGNSYVRIINTDTFYTPFVWAHYAVVRKNGVLKVYLDGKEIGSNSSYTSTAFNMSNFSIGGNSEAFWGLSYKGYMDDFAVYNYAKYDGNFTPPTTTADIDPANSTNNDQLDIVNNVTGGDFTNVGDSNLIGTAAEKKLGNASLYFPGSASQRINIQDEKLNLGTKDFTISFWSNQEEPGMTNPTFFSNEANNNLQLVSSANGNGFITLKLGGTVLINTNKKYTTGAWVHYSVVRDAGVFTLYENGINIGEANSYTTTAVNLSNLSIGGNQATTTTAYKGYMDDFAIYSYAKYNSDFTPPAVTADTDPANSANDSLEIKDEVTGGDFEILGGAKLTGKDTEKKFGDASLYFPGTTNGRINIKNEKLNFGTDDFTVSFWANPDVQTQPYGIFFSEDSNKVLDFMPNDLSSGNEIGLCINSSYIRIIDTDTVYTPGVWAHYAVVRKNGVLTIYQNGQNIGSTSDYTTTEFNMSNFSIGGNGGRKDVAYKGYIDDFSVYNYAVWDSDFTPPTTAGK